MYDENNIFAKIIRGEVPCEKVYEDENVLFFYDINPIAKIHVLGIPKVPCLDLADFIKKYEPSISSNFFEKTEIVINKLGVSKSGYKVVSNSGQDGGQEVPHFHIHILGGEKIVLKNL